MAEYFTVLGKHININNNRNFIGSINDTYHTAYGSIIIDPSDNETYIWTFKIHNCNSHCGIQIGINEYTKTSNTDCNFARNENNKHFSYCSSGKKYSQAHCQIFNKNGYESDHFVSMKLKFDSNCLFGSLYFVTQTIDNNTSSFGRSWHIAYNTVPKTNIKYQMAVCLRRSRIELTDFVVIKHQPLHSQSNDLKLIKLKAKNDSDTNTNTDKKQKKRVRSEWVQVIKTNEINGNNTNVIKDNNFNKPPLKKRKISKNNNKKANIKDKIQALFDKNRQLINKCNSYNKEKAEMLHKIQILEKSNAKYRNVLNKMLEIVNCNNNKCEQEINDSDKQYQPNMQKSVTNKCVDSKHAKEEHNKMNQKANSQIKKIENTSSVCMFCGQMVQSILQVIYCIQCKKICCTKTECQLIHSNMHKMPLIAPNIANAPFRPMYANYQLQQMVSMHSRIAAMSRYHSLATQNTNNNVMIPSNIRNSVVFYPNQCTQLNNSNKRT